MSNCRETIPLSFHVYSRRSWMRDRSQLFASCKQLRLSHPAFTQVRSRSPTCIAVTNNSSGLSFTYSHVVMPPLIAHAPPKLLAKQWLQAYQFAPIFVAPLVLLGASSNALLAYLSAGRLPRTAILYSTAAVAIISIIPYTALYMEPGINGAGKWKAQELLRDEFELKGQGHGTDKDTARAGWKRWAERVDMKTIAELWAMTNAWRYVITGIATAISATATVIMT